MSTKQFVKEVIELTYNSCKNHMWDYMDKLDYDAVDDIYDFPAGKPTISIVG